MLSSYDIEQRALEKLKTCHQEADRARALRAGAKVLQVHEAFRRLILTIRFKAHGRVPVDLNAK